MLELLDQLKKLPKEVLMLIIFDLMKDEGRMNIRQERIDNY